MRILLRAAVFAGACLFVSSIAAAAERIVVGQSVPLTGPSAELGRDIRDGAAAYFRKVNDAGGIHGRAIELVSLDDRNDRAAAGANAARLVNEQNAIALFGFASATLSLDAMPLVKDKHVPFFAPFTGADAMRRQGPYVFTMRASYAEEIAKILEHWKGFGVERVTVLHYDDEIGNQNFATVERDMKAAGKSAAGVKFARGGRITPAQVEAIVKSDPQVILATTSYENVVQVLKALKEKQRPYNVASLSFVGPSQLAKAAGVDAAGVSVAGVVPPPAKSTIPVIKECGDALKAAGVAELNYTNLEACIAAKVLVEGLRRAGAQPTRESLYKALAAMEHYDAGGYTVGFGSPDRQGSHFVELSVISKEGKFRF